MPKQKEAGDRKRKRETQEVVDGPDPTELCFDVGWDDLEQWDTVPWDDADPSGPETDQLVVEFAVSGEETSGLPLAAVTETTGQNTTKRNPFDKDEAIRQALLRRNAQDCLVKDHQRGILGILEKCRQARAACCAAATQIRDAVPKAPGPCKAPAAFVHYSAIVAEGASPHPLIAFLHELLCGLELGFSAPQPTVVRASDVATFAPDEIAATNMDGLCGNPWMACALLCAACDAADIRCRIAAADSPEPTISPLTPAKRVSGIAKAQGTENYGACWCELSLDNGKSWFGVASYPMKGPVITAPYVFAFGPDVVVDITARYTSGISSVSHMRLDFLPLRLPPTTATQWQLHQALQEMGQETTGTAQPTTEDFPVPVSLVPLGEGLGTTTRNWLERTLEAFGPASPNAEVVAERRTLYFRMHAEPVPKTIKGLKDHPLFVAPQHIGLRYIIAPAAKPLPAFINGMPLYSRLSVHECETREGWLKRGYIVREDEVPVKKVAPLPSKSLKQTERFLFGIWQTERQRPPELEDGRIPTDRWGTIHLAFGIPPPSGTVHITNQPKILAAAKSINVECVPVIVGWTWSTTRRVPQIHGAVIHERDQEAVLAACARLEAGRLFKQQLERELAVVERWERLAKALVIRHKLLAEAAADGDLHLVTAGTSNSTTEDAVAPTTAPVPAAKPKQMTRAQAVREKRQKIAQLRQLVDLTNAECSVGSGIPEVLPDD
eukprot:TRINITY_DN7381_c0_g1_i1.p1 TRINITY_DN7381_c0_g1~~TRINITY_DN7381_c0_g1_i1.p1  ORF type:complete len:723 (+),score=97.91 TRINITY_DN7381_c0_g1_i1:29-2197(+)